MGTPRGGIFRRLRIVGRRWSMWDKPWRNLLFFCWFEKVLFSPPATFSLAYISDRVHASVWNLSIHFVTSFKSSPFMAMKRSFSRLLMLSFLDPRNSYISVISIHTMIPSLVRSCDFNTACLVPSSVDVDDWSSPKSASRSAMACGAEIRYSL